MLFLKNNIKVPLWAVGLLPMMILPLVSTLVIGILMYFVIGVPIVWATKALTGFLMGMQGSARFIFGMIMGGMAAFDFGGPVNKVASLFADGLLLEGIKEPEAVKILASMVPPFGVTISLIISRLIKKKKYSKLEEDNIKIAFPMGICMITEGVIPIAAVDPIRVIASCTIGAAIGGGISMYLGIGSPVPSGGMFIVPAMNHPLLFCLALLIGSVITALLLVILKREPKENEINSTEEDEGELDLSSVKIS
nr:PTS fructose transporter subunit IIC [Sodalis ligni]